MNTLNILGKKSTVLLCAVAISIFAFTSCGGNKTSKSGSEASLQDLRDSFSFAVGFNYGLQLKQRQLEDINIEALGAGVQNAFGDDSDWIISPELYQDIVERFTEKNTEKLSAENIKESEKFIAEKSKEDGVNREESGLLWKVLREGQGPMPNITDTAIVHVRIEFPDGSLFEDSEEYDDPLMIPISGAWPGMVEGMQLMKKGSIYEFYVPYEIGFGPTPVMRGIPPNKALVYRINMIDFK